MTRVVDIDSNFDTVIPFHLVTGNAAIAIAIRHRLSTIKGEIVLDQSYGVGWFRADTGFIVEDQYIPDLIADIQDQIAHVEGVETVDLVDVRIEQNPKHYVIDYRVNGGSLASVPVVP